ncbi:LOW QUALITY PROTEIN: hypothetical protein PHMEG_0002260 [Phytophthora megakarya]|uniref:WLGC domain-containing protein n=1 Tax=Phytophthora megakarya TaxID=4795 RepID=A0A225X0V5_9STRA|nr:LOW QUALITY PROTEIN: hypothetical protein PHMEG_0002260 [Phytophthora megakarya]
MVLLCLMWTTWLILLNSVPNAAVNRIMDTGAFDDGSFWLFVDSPPRIYRLAIVGLSSVGLGYLLILVKLLTKRRCVTRILPTTKSDRKVNARTNSIAETVNNIATTLNRTASRSLGSAALLVSNDSLARKRINLCVKFVDLALETAMLVQILEDGSPLGHVAGFAFIVVANAIGCALIMFFPSRTKLFESLVDLMYVTREGTVGYRRFTDTSFYNRFDLLIAVGYPIFTVWYCFSTFTFDRTKFAINLEVFPPGWRLETSAGSIADPTQTIIIYKILGSLRISSVLNFFTRVGINITLALKFFRASDLINNPSRQQGEVYPKQNGVAAATLVVFAVLLIVYTEESIRTSATVCRPHSECVTYAHRWTALECPCLALIDNEIAPKTYAEWTNPKNVTDKVAVLAATGDLQIIQLTNRNFAVIPNEIRGCTKMRYIQFIDLNYSRIRTKASQFINHRSLVYTQTKTIPVWMKELRKLEFLRIEGHPVGGGLVSLPDDIFDDMSVLTTLHMASNAALTHFPSVLGLTNLKLFAVATSFSLVELPAFDNLSNLERLVVVITPLLTRLPDLSAIKKLKSFVTMDRGAWCCNGFLGKCDLHNPLCDVHPVWGTPAATCLPANRMDLTASIATRDIAAKFAQSICGDVLRPADVQPLPAEDTMISCNGVLYHQCTFPGALEAICYNARFMGIACTPSKYPIEMRRRQIAQGVGDPCNPEYEAWLGCK